MASDSDSVKEAFAAAIKHAIKAVGVSRFKETSMFKLGRRGTLG